jgi:hypothetical protein
MKQAIDEWRKIGTKEFRKLVEDEQVQFEYFYILCIFYFINRMNYYANYVKMILNRLH